MAASGDGTAPPESGSSAARSASRSRRPADLRRFRASLATIASSQGRKGAPRRKRPSDAVGLDEGLLHDVLGVGGRAREQVGGAKRDRLMLLHEGAEGAGVALLRAGDELVVCQWPVLHCTRSTPSGGSAGSAAQERGSEPVDGPVLREEVELAVERPRRTRSARAPRTDGRAGRARRSSPAEAPDPAGAVVAVEVPPPTPRGCASPR